MKELLFLRHAKSSWNYAVADRHRPLKEKGIRRMEAMAHKSTNQFQNVTRFYSSPANRALHTATIALHTWQFPLDKLIITETLYSFEAKSVMEFIKNLPNEHNSVCLIGHNPALSVAAAELTNKLTQHMPTAAWVKIIFDQSCWKDVCNGQGLWGLPKQLLDE